MSVDKNGVLFWCKSVEETFQPRENVSPNEKPKQIPEQFLAAALEIFARCMCRTS